MKRGIPFALQAAGTLLICLAACINNPVASVPAIGASGDTVRYYNEGGELIFCNTKALAPGNYVVRSCSTHRQVYPELYTRDSTQSMSDYKPAEVHPITVAEARLVDSLIRRGRLDDPKVIKNIIPILDLKTILAMLYNIKDTRWNIYDTTDFSEYGGIVRRDSSLSFWKGEATDPCTPKNKGLNISDTSGIADYHSHPSGERDGVNKEGKVIVCSFVQAPSRVDQDAIQPKGIGYVFGMNKKSHRIYIYDSTGILATLPIGYILSVCN